MTLNLSPLELLAWGLGALALLAALWLLTAYRRRLARVAAEIVRQQQAPFSPEASAGADAASVVIVASNDASALERLLAKLFEQEWTGRLEVVVVNDGKNPDVKDVVTRLKHLRGLDNLFITFTPPGLRNISRQKLALTLGIKAAHHPVVVCLTENSRLYSTQWLGRMLEPFARPEIDVVVGSAMPGPKFDSGLGSRYRSFTLAADTVEWLSAALRSRPWRAHRANMAFRRQLFFDSGGFNSALNLRDGDDDIFIAKIARRDNVAVVCAPQAAVRYSEPTPLREFRQGRSRRHFTSRRLPARRRAARFFGFSSLMLWTMLAAAAGAIALGAWLADWVILAIAATMLVGVAVGLGLTWRRALRALRARPAALMVVPMLLRRPLTNARHRLRSRRHRAEYRTTSA